MAACALSAAPLAQAHAKKPRPRITATPAVLLSGESTTLEGSGFPADTTITLRECPSTTGGPPKPACNSTESQLTVETGANGGFTAMFPVTPCRDAKQAGRSQRCYVGEYRAGLDFSGLVGAAKLTVNP